MSDKRYRHLDCPQCINLYRQKRKHELGYEACKEKHKGYVVKYRYKISHQDYKSLLQKQDYKCALCKVDISEKKAAHLDHCHSTGKIRGFLCGNCNKALGLFKDSTEVLSNAIKYLENNEVKIGNDLKNLEKVKYNG